MPNSTPINPLDPNGYPEDLTATSTRNKIVNEVHEFKEDLDKIFIPDAGPFYEKGFVMINDDNGALMQPIVDYNLLEPHFDANEASGKNVFIVVVVTNKTIKKVRLSYQVIGGNFANVLSTVIKKLNNVNWDRANKVNWGTGVYGKPILFDPAKHKHGGEDFTGWQKFTAALRDISSAIRYGNTAAWGSFYQYVNLKIGKSISNFESRIKRLEERSTVDVSSFLTAADINQLVDLKIKTAKEELRRVKFRIIETATGTVPDDKTISPGDARENKFLIVRATNATASTPVEVTMELKTDADYKPGQFLVIRSGDHTSVRLSYDNSIVVYGIGDNNVVCPEQHTAATLVYRSTDRWDIYQDPVEE